MVLDYDEPSQSSSGDFGGDTPMSDSDSYFSPEGQKWYNKEFARFPTKITMPPFTLTRRIIHWSELYYESALAKSIIARMETARAMVNRNPTQEETDAFVSQSSLLFDIPEALGYVGAGVGVYMWKKQERFELKEAEVETGKLSPSMKSKMLRWSRIRGVVLFPFFFVAGYWIGNVVSRIGMGVVASTDGRLTRFKEDAMSQNPEEVNKRLAQLRERMQARSRAMMEERRKQVQARASGTSSHADDASPTGSYSESGDSFSQYGSSQQQSGDSKILNEVYSRPNNGFQQQQSQQQQQQPQPSQSRDFWDDDDASPTNPAIDTTPSTTSSSGSAWERIRQSAAAQGSSNPRGFVPQPPPQQQQQQSSNENWQSSDYVAGRDSGDRYSRDTRQEAQRDFDRLIDRDRDNGSDQERDGGNAWSRKW